MEDPVWFSPYKVLSHCHKIKKTATPAIKKTKNYRKVTEAEAVATMLIGLMAANGHKKDFWMQVVDDKYSSPDIRTLCYSDEKHPTLDFLEKQDVEAVEYEDHSKETVVEFIEKTKFSKMKAYDARTHILCYLGGTSTTVTLRGNAELQKQVANTKINAPTLFIAPLTGRPAVYRLVQLYPAVRVIKEFNLRTEFNKNASRQPHTMHFVRGSRKPWKVNPEEKNYPFQQLGFIPNAKDEYEFD